MFKLSALFSGLFFMGCSWFSNFQLPRLTESSMDFFLMPFLGYLSIFLAAQMASRLLLGKSSHH